MEDEIAIIKSRKYNGDVHRSWKAKFIKREDSRLEFVGRFEKEIVHPYLGVIRRNTVSYEFYWLDRWYNIFRFHEPEGELRNFYCNINMPPVFDNLLLDYIDLDIDVLVWKDFTYKILDMDEFEQNTQKYFYPNDLRVKVKIAVSELISMIEQRVFPFDYIF